MQEFNKLFVEKEQYFIYVEDIAAMNDLDDYMCGFHRISIAINEVYFNQKKVLKLCFGDLVDEKKLAAALEEYFENE